MTGDELRKIRQDLGYTQEKMAYALYLQQAQYICAMESGSRNISHRTGLLARELHNLWVLKQERIDG